MITSPIVKNITNHNDLDNIQGEIPEESYHLNNNEYSNIVNKVQTSPIRAGFHYINQITNNYDGTISIPSNACDFYNDELTEIRHYIISDNTSLSLVNNTTNYIYADRDTLSFNSTTDETIINDIGKVRYAEVYMEGTVPYIIHSQVSPVLGYTSPERRGHRQYHTNRYGIESGFNTISVDTSLNITTGGGDIWAGDVLFSLNSTTSLPNSGTVLHFCYHVDGVWTIDSGYQPKINNTQYDDGTNLVLMASNTRWTINYIYRGIENEDHLYITLSPTDYASSTLAKGSSTIHTPPDIIKSHAFFIGRVIVRRNQIHEDDTGDMIKEIYSLTKIYTTATPVNDHNLLDLIQGGSVDEYYHLTSSEYTGTGTNIFVRQNSPIITGDLTLSKISGNGIKVDADSPTFGWRDITASIHTVIGDADPDWVVYRTNGLASISAYRFTNGGVARESFINFHIPHDYVPGTDLFIHTHWSQIIVDTGGIAGIPGVVEWHFDISYSDGHGTPGGVASPFSAPIATLITQQASTVQYGHMIAEVQFTNNGGDITHLNRNIINIDGIIVVRVWRDSGVIPDTLNQSPYLHFVDLHYQSTNISTKNKAPNFYI